jgi:hypothetical protein
MGMRSNALVVTVAVALVGAGTLTAHAAWLVPGSVGCLDRTLPDRIPRTERRTHDDATRTHNHSGGQPRHPLGRADGG